MAKGKGDEEISRKLAEAALAAARKGEPQPGPEIASVLTAKQRAAARMPRDVSISIDRDPPRLDLGMTLTRPGHVWAMIDVVESFTPLLPSARPGKAIGHPMARLPSDSWINVYDNPLTINFRIVISRREDAVALFEALSKFISLERGG
jgi:hypothetical protein